VDEKVLWWTLSSLFQGLCALYGLFLVWYVFRMTKSSEGSKELAKEYSYVWRNLYKYRKPTGEQIGVEVGVDGEKKVVRREWTVPYDKERKASLRMMAMLLLRVRKAEKEEKAVLFLLLVYSVMFMMVSSVLISGLTVGDWTVSFWWGTLSGWFMVVIIGGVFEGISIFRLMGVKESEGYKLPRTSVKNLVKRGRWFFDEGLSLSLYIYYVVKSKKDLRKGSFVDVKTGHFKSIDIGKQKDEWVKMKNFWCGW